MDIHFPTAVTTDATLTASFATTNAIFTPRSKRELETSCSKSHKGSKKAKYKENIPLEASEASVEAAAKLATTPAPSLQSMNPIQTQKPPLAATISASFKSKKITKNSTSLRDKSPASDIADLFVNRQKENPTSPNTNKDNTQGFRKTRTSARLFCSNRL
jgi:hypothetical protein